MLDNLRGDLGRFGEEPVKQLREVLLCRATWAVLNYRLQRAALAVRAPGPLRIALRLATHLIRLSAEIATNVDLPVRAVIGPGLLLPHSGNIVISSGAVIGRLCTLTQGVTIGHARGGAMNKRGDPRLGDRIYVGPCALILGPITVGDDVLIGAGAVVTKSIPPRAVVVGNPARILSYWGSFDLVEYPGMESDPARLASLALRHA